MNMQTSRPDSGIASPGRKTRSRKSVKRKVPLDDAPPSTSYKSMKTGSCGDGEQEKASNTMPYHTISEDGESSEVELVGPICIEPSVKTHMALTPSENNPANPLTTSMTDICTDQRNLQHVKKEPTESQETSENTAEISSGQVSATSEEEVTDHVVNSVLPSQTENGTSTIEQQSEDKFGFDRLRKFPEKLWDAVNDDSDLLAWSEDGLSIVVDENTFTNSITDVHPGLVQIPSFINFRRQLREYGFKWGILKKHVYYFTHTSFQKGHPQLLRLVKTRRHNRQGCDPQKKIRQSTKIQNDGHEKRDGSSGRGEFNTNVPFTQEQLAMIVKAMSLWPNANMWKHQLQNLHPSIFPFPPSEGGDGSMLVPPSQPQCVRQDPNMNNSNVNTNSNNNQAQEGSDYQSQMYSAGGYAGSHGAYSIAERSYYPGQNVGYQASKFTNTFLKVLESLQINSL